MKSLKILQVINSLPVAGAEKLVVEISKKYIQEGHSVEILILKPYGTALEQEVIDNPDINLHILGEKTSIYNPINILRIRRFLDNSNYDVIHVHLFPAFYWFALALKRKFGFLAVHTEHNTTNRRMNNPLFGWFDRFIYPRYDYHITISDAVRKNLLEHSRLNKEKLINIYNGIDLQSITNAEGYDKSSLQLEVDDVVLLQVSAFRPQKDQATVINAMPLLDDNIHLFFAGHGEQQNECMLLAKKLNVDDRVHFLGVRNDIPRLLKTADIVVLSSHYEGLSLSSVEGMASGKPFVASDVPGLSEVVKGAGILFPEGDVNGLVNSIKRLLVNEEFYTKTALACSERSKMYDMDVMVAEHLKLYNSKKE